MLGLSGGLAGVRARFDLFGVLVLALVVALAGGIARDLLIGTPPAKFRDWRYLAAAGLATFAARPILERICSFPPRPGLLGRDITGVSLVLAV